MSPGKNGLEERSSSVRLISDCQTIPQAKLLTVLLKVLLAGCQELDSSKLVSVLC
jgi:hypothetical protein